MGDTEIPSACGDIGPQATTSWREQVAYVPRNTWSAFKRPHNEILIIFVPKPEIFPLLHYNISALSLYASNSSLSLHIRLQYADQPNNLRQVLEPIQRSKLLSFLGYAVESDPNSLSVKHHMN